MQCTPHLDGHRCDLEGTKHRDHCHLVDGEWVYWTDPEPQSQYAHRHPPSTVKMLKAVEMVTDTDPAKLARTDGPETSKRAAKGLRTGSQKSLLLATYVGQTDGLTDEEAAVRAGLADRRGCCWWHRCGDLRDDGLVMDTGQTRAGSSGEERMVCVITEEGTRVWASGRE